MSMFADNPDFFPTPRQIARKMLARITNKEAKYFLEPSAGKGDIADAIRNPCTFEEFEEEHPEYAERNCRAALKSRIGIPMFSMPVRDLSTPQLHSNRGLVHLNRGQTSG